MSNHFINSELLQSFNLDEFKKNKPFPWFNFHSFLIPEAFSELYLNFPSLELFEKHVGLNRNYGQRPHNRYYLAYENSIYKNQENDKGIVKYEDLPVSWQKFIEELETSQIYDDFIKAALEVQDYRVRYAWHLGHNDSEVSPHRDAVQKIGTHIFYFNTSEDWDIAWGGSTLVLGGKLSTAQNPDFDDFTLTKASQITDNHSFLFKNTDVAWHGVKALTCPPAKFRRLFNVIFEFPYTNELSGNVYPMLTLSAGKNFFKKILRGTI